MFFNRIILFIALLHFASDAYSQSMFRRTYGLGAVNECIKVIQTSDNGFAIAGSTTPFVGGQTDFYLLKTDSMGIDQYQASFGSSGIDQATSIYEMPDNGFIVAGNSNGYSLNNDYNIHLVRTDQTGSVLWTKTFGTTDWDFVYDMKPTPDGNLLIAGNSFGSGNGTSSGYIVKLDTSGNIIWQKFIELNQLVNLKKIAVKPDGSFVVCGNVSPVNSYPNDGFIAFLDVNGDTTRTIIFDNGKRESFNAVGFFTGGDLAICGTTIDSANNNNKDELILRIDTLGTPIWYYAFAQSGTDISNDLIVYNDTLVIAGATTTFAAGKSDFHIVRFDQNATFIDGNTYGGGEDEFCNSLLFTYDRGFLLGGTTTTYGPSQQSILLVKSDYIFTYNPNVTIDVFELTEKTDWNIFPNPSKGNFYVTGLNSGNYQISVFNNYGELILKKSISNFNSQIDITQFDSGIYHIEISGKTSTLSKRIVLLK